MKRFFLNMGLLGAAALSVWIASEPQAQAQTAVWTNQYNGPASDSDHATAVAVDGSGKVFVTGQSSGIGSGMDYATVAYSSAGVLLWTNRYNGPRNSFDSASAIAVDASGNVFVTGWSGTAITGRYDNYDYATIKYSGAGVPLWTNRYNGPADTEDYARALAVDSSGNVVVTGDSASNLWPYNSACATVKYSSAGVPLWTNRYSSPGNTENRANAVAVDSSGNVVVTGESPHGTVTTLAYSSAGAPLWTNRYGSASTPVAVVVDGSGNVVVAGYSYAIGSASSYDYVTIKYSGAGVPLWTNLYNGPANSADYAAAAAVDGSGNVFVTGDSLGSGSKADYATVAYSGAGVPLWTNRYNSPVRLDAGAVAVGVDRIGNVYVTGDAPGLGGYSDCVTIKYSGAGMPLWTNRYDGPANDTDYAAAMAVNASGTVAVAGSSYRATANYDYLTLMYSDLGQGYSMDWSTIDGGGGISTGGVYSMSGTIGQPDANSIMSGGDYTFAGGFWSLVAAVQTPGAPLLTITRSGNSVVVSWPSSSSGFMLQQNSDMANPNGWSAYGGAIKDDGTNRNVIFSPPTGSWFFRLYK